AETSARVVERRLAAAEGRVHPGALPLTDRAVLVVTDVVPMEPRSVRHVDHPLVLVGRTRLLPEQAPRLVEQGPRQLTLVGDTRRLRLGQGHHRSSFVGQ